MEVELLVKSPFPIWVEPQAAQMYIHKLHLLIWSLMGDRQGETPDGC